MTGFEEPSGVSAPLCRRHWKLRGNLLCAGAVRFRRSSLVGFAIIIIVFVVFIHNSKRMVQRFMPVENTEKERNVGLVEYGMRAKLFVSPDLSEKHHIVYIKIPKTGSSTTAVLLWRYAWTRNLSLLASHPHYSFSKLRLNSKQFFLPQPGNKADIMAEQVMYNKKNYAPYFHSDTLYFTQLREPMSMLQSMLYYLDEFQRALPGHNKVESYLQDPNRYDRVAIMADRSYTRNPQSSYLGLPVHHFNSVQKIKELIHSIEKDFALVMILEKFDESLILFRRLTNWPVKDLIYWVQNTNKNKPNPRASLTERQTYRNWSLADHMFYDYFSKKLETQIAEAGPSFHNELELFKQYKSDAAHYCRFETITDNVLSIPATPYHEGFTISRRDCSLIQVEPLILISDIRRRQNSSPYLNPDLLRS